MQDKKKRELFRHYITVRAAEGTHPASNMEFWLEVQRFKVSRSYEHNIIIIPTHVHLLQYMYLTQEYTKMCLQKRKHLSTNTKMFLHKHIFNHLTHILKYLFFEGVGKGVFYSSVTVHVHDMRIHTQKKRLQKWKISQMQKHFSTSTERFLRKRIFNCLVCSANMSHVFLSCDLCCITCLQDMFHAHMNVNLLRDKMNAVITCYLHSLAPPRVQVHV